MAVQLKVVDLPDPPSAAAAAFYDDWLPKVTALLKPLPFRGGVGGGVCPSDATFGNADKPHPNPSPEGEGLDVLTLAFPAANHTHTAWRLAAVQSLAREHAPARVNGTAGGSVAAIAAALAYLEAADGVTGQYLLLDDAGAGPVVVSAA